MGREHPPNVWRCKHTFFIVVGLEGGGLLVERRELGRKATTTKKTN